MYNIVKIKLYRMYKHYAVYAEKVQVVQNKNIENSIC